MKHAFPTLAALVLLGTAAHAQQPTPRVIIPPVMGDFTQLDVARVPFITETGDLMKSQSRRNAHREDWLYQHPAPRPYRSNETDQLNWEDMGE